MDFKISGSTGLHLCLHTSLVDASLHAIAVRRQDENEDDNG